MIDLNDMMLFAQVVEAGSFTTAARELGMPKSTLSRRISTLESQLDSRLLQRTTRALRLTEIGTKFHAHCLRVVAEAKEAELTINLSQEEPRGELRITAPIEYGDSLLGPLVAQYLMQHPHVRLELDLSNRIVDLVGEGFDLAIRAGKLEDSNMIARQLGESRIAVCASPRYLKDHPAPKTPKQLGEHTCLLYPNSDGRTTLQFNRTNELIQVHLEGKLTTNSLGTLQDAAIAGLGITILPWSLCRDAVEQQLLVPILKDWQLPISGIYAVYPSPRHLTPTVRSFIDFIISKL
ncbi:MAG: LysR family transcriptional regulator [Gammaproteobacteria bacterium]|nr:LysR family transcriptional regulator [Gammaproteobacteria bacterium]